MVAGKTGSVLGPANFPAAALRRDGVAQFPDGSWDAWWQDQSGMYHGYGRTSLDALVNLNEQLDREYR